MEVQEKKPTVVLCSRPRHKSEIRHFHAVVVQWRQSVMYVRSCCFANWNLLGQLFKRSLAIVWPNGVLSHFQFAQRFYLNTIYREKFMKA